jgi:hypothetical protein
MLEKLQAHWRDFTRGTPGHRFRERYQRNHHRSRRTQWTMRIIRVVMAVIAIAIGLVLAVLPGPAVLFFFAAGMLLATEWLWMAKALDWLEVRLRRLAKVAGRMWKQLPSVGRVALVALGVTLSVASTWGIYQLVR